MSQESSNYLLVESMRANIQERLQTLNEARNLVARHKFVMRALGMLTAGQGVQYHEVADHLAKCFNVLSDFIGQKEMPTDAINRLIAKADLVEVEQANSSDGPLTVFGTKVTIGERYITRNGREVAIIKNIRLGYPYMDVSGIFEDGQPGEVHSWSLNGKYDINLSEHPLDLATRFAGKAPVKKGTVTGLPYPEKQSHSAVNSGNIPGKESWFMVLNTNTNYTRMQHRDYPAAAREANRLAKAQQGHEFVVLKALASFCAEGVAAVALGGFEPNDSDLHGQEIPF